MYIGEPNKQRHAEDAFNIGKILNILGKPNGRDLMLLALAIVIDPHVMCVICLTRKWIDQIYNRIIYFHQ